MTRSASDFWSGKVAVVTGGTAGLGRELVSQLAAAGARVGIVARTRTRLDEVVAELRRAGVTAAGAAADVEDETSAHGAIRRLQEELGPVDVLVNNVGVSSRMAIGRATASDYLAAFRVNFFSAVHCTQPILPELRARCGSVVNIASLAARTAWPFLAPYSASKSALALWSNTLRLEQGPELHVLLVCPGPIRRDDSGTRYSDQASTLPAAASAAGAGVRLRGIDPVWMAGRILRGIRRRDREIVCPSFARLAFAVAQLSPAAGDWLLRRFGAVQDSRESEPSATPAAVPKAPSPAGPFAAGDPRP